MAYAYENQWSSMLSSLSSFARGWATMQVQLDQQQAAEERWQQEFDFRKTAQMTAEEQWNKSHKLQRDRLAQEASIAKREYDFKNMQWDEGENLRKLQLDTAQLNKRAARMDLDYKETVRTETAEATSHMFSMIPSLLNTPSEKIGTVYLDAMADTMKAFPNADMTKYQALFNTIASSKLFQFSRAKMSSKTLDFTDEKGNKMTQLFDEFGKPLATFSHNIKSDEVRALINVWNDKVTKRREEMFKAFAQGSSAKFKGEFNISMQDLNNLDVNFHEIAGFANQILDWVERDDETAKMRKSFEKALALEVKDEKERIKIVESVFGVTPEIRQEEYKTTVKRYSDIYKSMVVKNKNDYPTEADPVADFWRLYQDILDGYSGEDVVVLTDALKDAAHSYFTAEPHLEEEFLRGLDEVARQWMQSKELGFARSQDYFPEEDLQEYRGTPQTEVDWFQMVNPQ